MGRADKLKKHFAKSTADCIQGWLGREELKELKSKAEKGDLPIEDYPWGDPEKDSFSGSPKEAILIGIRQYPEVFDLDVNDEDSAEIQSVVEEVWDMVKEANFQVDNL